MTLPSWADINKSIAIKTDWKDIEEDYGKGLYKKPIGGTFNIRPYSFEEDNFQKAYKEMATKMGLSLDPDDERHFYDWRALYKEDPTLTPDAENHFPSEHKLPGHPREVVEGVDTVTGKPVVPPKEGMGLPVGPQSQPFPELEEMKVQENNIKSMSETYAGLSSSLDTDYEQYEDLSKQLDEIEAKIEEAPPDMLFSLGQKRNGIAVQYNTLVDKLKTETKRHQTLYTQLDTESKSFNMNVNAYNQYVLKEVAESFTVDYIPESDLKDNFDAFRLGWADLVHKGKQYFTAALPNLIYADIRFEDQKYYKIQGQPGLTEEQVKKVNEVNKGRREEAKEIYLRAEERYDKWLVDNPELVPRPEWSGGVIENVKKDPSILLDSAYWGYEAAQSASFMLAVMGTTLGVTAVTGNPFLGMAAGVVVATPSQSQDVWDELVANGATEQQASKIAVPLGVAIASVEVLGDLPLLAAVSKPFKKLLFKGIKTEIVKRTALSIAKSGVKTFFAVEGAEIFEENIQGAMQDAAVNMFRENVSLLEKIPETTVKTFMATAPWALFGGGANVRSNINERLKQKIAENNLKIAVETLKPVEILEKPEEKPVVERKPEPKPEVPKVEPTEIFIPIIKENIIPKIEKIIEETIPKTDIKQPQLGDIKTVILFKVKEMINEEILKAKNLKPEIELPTEAIISKVEKIIEESIPKIDVLGSEVPVIKEEILTKVEKVITEEISKAVPKVEPKAPKPGQFNLAGYTYPEQVGRELVSYPTDPGLLARQAELIFEGYFPVNKDKEKPHYPVIVGEQDLEAAITNLREDFGGAENYPEAQAQIEKAQEALDQLSKDDFPQIPITPKEGIPKTAVSEPETLKALEEEAVRLGRPSWDKMTRKEVITLLDKTRAFKDPEGKLIKKLGNVKIDLWKDNNYSMFVGGAEKEHVITNSHWLFVDSTVADKIIAEQKKKIIDKSIKDYMNTFSSDKDFSYADAEKMANEGWDKMETGQYPDWKGIIDDTKKVKDKTKVYTQGQIPGALDGGATTVMSNGTTQVYIATDYVALMEKRFPDGIWQLADSDLKPVSIVVDNKIAAIVMPIRRDEDSPRPWDVWDIPGGVKPTAEEITKKESALADEQKAKKEEESYLKRPVKKQETLIPGMEEPLIAEEQELSAKQWGQVMEKEAVVKETISKTNIMSWAEEAFGFPIKGKATHRWKAAGVFYGHKQIIRMAKWGELAVAAHEIAHGIDQQIAKKLFNKWKWGKLKGITGEFAKELADLDYDQNQRRTSEGFAEYMRYELTQGIGKEKAPGFHKYFNESILPQFPEIKKNLDTFRSKLDIWNKQGAENRIIQHIDWKGEQTETRGLMPKLRKALEWVNIRFNDEFYLPQKIVKGIEKIIGKEIRPSQNPAILMEYSKAKSGAIARTFVMDKAIDEHGNVIGPSLSDVLKPIPNKEMEQFVAYAVSKRALNLAGRGIESGFDIDDSKFIINRYKDRGWDETVKGVTNWSNHMLDWIVRAGGLSEEAATLMRDLNPLYVPFKRAFLDELSVTKGVGGYVDTGSGVKAIKGSGRPIINPIEAMITQTRELIAKAQKIRIARTFIDLAEEHGVGGFITKVPAPMKATTFSANQIKGYLDEIAGGEEGVTGSSEYNDFLTVFTQDFKYNGKENIVTIWKDGKQEFYEIHPDLYEAFKGVDTLKLNALTKVFAPYARMLRLGATGCKLSFGLARNPFRDAFSYVVFSKRNNTTVFDPIKGFYKDVFTKEGEATWRFKKLGGGLSGQIGLDRASVQNSYDEMLELKLGKVGKLLHIVKHPINALSDLVSITEMGPRSAEIEASYKKYTSEKWQKNHPDWTEEDAFIQAFCDAQDVTVNFTKSGKWAKQINQVTAFFNVSIRGPEKLYRSIKERPIQTFVKGTLWLTTIAVASWYRNKDKDWYKNLPPAYKYNNLFFEIGGNVFRLPIPFELGIIFMAAPQAALDTMKDQDTKSLKGLLDLAQAQIPNPMPSVFQPAYNVATNKNYLGVPIESEGMQYLYPTERKRDYTTKTAIALSKGMDKIGIQLSPIQLDYMFDSYSGGFIRQFRITGEELSDLPVIGDLMLRDPSYPKRQLNEYFSDWEYLRQREQSGIATRAEIRELNRIDGFYKTYKTLQGNITKAKKANNQILVEKYSNIMRERLERYGYK